MLPPSLYTGSDLGLTHHTPEAISVGLLALVRHGRVDVAVVVTPRAHALEADVCNTHTRCHDLFTGCLLAQKHQAPH